MGGATLTNDPWSSAAGPVLPQLVRDGGTLARGTGTREAQILSAVPLVFNASFLVLCFSFYKMGVVLLVSFESTLRFTAVKLCVRASYSRFLLFASAFQP